MERRVVGKYLVILSILTIVNSIIYAFPLAKNSEQLKYINNAAAGYWVDVDGLNMIRNLEKKTERIIQTLENNASND